MNSVINIIKMDFAMCKKSMIILIFSMVVSGIGCLFFLTPMLLGFFVVGSTTAVSAIFAIESKSNMEFFYGCFPIRKQDYIIGRSCTCLLIMIIPSVISIIFTQAGIHFSLCRINEMKMLTESTREYQMLITCAMIMMGFVGGANLLLASFTSNVESREILQVILLLAEGLIIGIILYIIQKIVWHGDSQAFFNAFTKFFSSHEILSCIVLILAGFIALFAGTLISLKLYTKKNYTNNKQ